MSEHEAPPLELPRAAAPTELHAFAGAGAPVVVALPFRLADVVADWSSLRVPMTRALPDAFRRDEWAYLIRFLEEGNLMRPFLETFGARAEPNERGAASGGCGTLARPRGPIAVWLPNNVSLLGPLTLVWASLTGNPLLLKGGSESEDLTGALLDFVRAHLRDGALRAHLATAVRYERFGRDDARHRAWAENASVRVIFGSDEAAQAIEALPHSPESASFAFVDRRSEAWIEPERVDDALLETLVAVFAIYGQAGCTSPRRVVLLGGDEALARTVRDRLRELWPRVVRARVARHAASGNVMARQWAAALGCEAVLTADNAAVLALGEASSELEAPMLLPIVARTVDEAVAELPANVQTIGHALLDAGHSAWLARLATSRVKRFVPLADMHHFAPRWDGTEFWRQAFEHVEVVP